MGAAAGRFPAPPPTPVGLGGSRFGPAGSGDPGQWRPWGLCPGGAQIVFPAVQTKGSLLRSREECDFAAAARDEASSRGVRRWAHKYSPSLLLFISLVSSRPISPRDGSPIALQPGRELPGPAGPPSSLCRHSRPPRTYLSPEPSGPPPRPLPHPVPSPPQSTLSLVSRNDGQETVALKAADFLLRAKQPASLLKNRSQRSP